MGFHECRIWSQGELRLKKHLKISKFAKCESDTSLASEDIAPQIQLA